MSPGLIQNLIHHLEVGAGSRYLRVTALIAAVIALGILYDIRAARDFAAPEAMDSAQVAHNLADGKGFATDFIRPFSLYLVQQHHRGAESAASASSLNETNAPAAADAARVITAHPDLANPPVYPLLLAGLMKILPFDFKAETERSYWSDNGIFQRYEPEFVIMLFNEILLLVVVLLSFTLARQLFDSSIAWFSAILVLGSDELWHFSAAGLSTILLLDLFLALSICLLQFERRARETAPPRHLLFLAIAAGVLVALGTLTRYAFGWTIIPTAIFIGLFGGKTRHTLVTIAAFIIVMLPWVIRNEVVSGTLFGTAGYALMENTALFPKFQLERSLHPDLAHVLWPRIYLQKLLAGVREIFSNDLPRLGHSWATILFLAGLLLNFRSVGARRLRYFLIMCLGLFVIVQALGRTALSDETPVFNSENLLIILAPVVFIFGVSFFFTLLDGMALPLPQFRFVVIGIFGLLCCLPLLFALLPPRPSPLIYPPYYPPNIQKVAGWVRSDEMMMSDVPWAVAWYGNRQCAWLTLNAQDDFNDLSRIKTVHGLYLTPKTMDGRFLSDWGLAAEKSWGNFIFQAITENRIVSGFPLRHAPSGFLPEQMFLSDEELWKTSP